jgi:hypothetical protein
MKGFQIRYLVVRIKIEGVQFILDNELRTSPKFSLKNNKFSINQKTQSITIMVVKLSYRFPVIQKLDFGKPVVLICS